MTNNDPDVALTGFAFNDGLPDGLAIATPNGLVNNAGGTATAVAGTQSFSYSGGSVPAGGTATVSINITGTVLGVKKSQYIAATSTQADPINAPRSGSTPVYRTGIAPHTFGRQLLTGSIGAGDPTQTGRMNRFAVISTIAAPKPYPGDFTTSGARAYDSYTIVNSTTSPQPCEVWSSTGTAGFVAAYLGSFNPASVSTNYLADPGSSWPDRGWFGFTIPASSTVVLVVHEVNPGTGVPAYALGINTPLPPVTAANVATFDAALPSIEVIVGGPLVFTGVPVTVSGGDFIATGKEVPTRQLGAFTPGPAPTPGTSYTYLQITGAANSIIGTFNDLPDGGVIAMDLDGDIYYFTVDYTAGVDGNDLVFTNFTPTASPAWKWVAGPDSRNAVGIYGTLGTGASTNNPGARQGAMQWRALDGSLWMFGGYGYATTLSNPPRWLNDLWQYDRTAGEWVWQAGNNTQNQVGNYGTLGLAAGTNKPGARHSGTTWTDTDGNLWLFGGYGYGSSGGVGRLNDLWRFDVVTKQWTWMKGGNAITQAGVYSGAASALTPGSRQGAASWATPGTLWLFGGTSDGTGTFFNDLWSYDITTGDWTVVSGTAATNQNGTYGTQGTPAAANVPGSRRVASSWVGADGSLWLFGGQGLGAATTTVGDLNDLWRFDVTLGQWEWVRGSDAINSVGSYGTKGVSAPTNDPAARGSGGSWSTVDGKFWLIGGLKNLNGGPVLNDVWIFDPATEEWTWKLGSSSHSAPGSYGTLGTASPTNEPGARYTPSTWVTLNGTLWVFGGGGIDAFGNGGRLSDLWSYGIPMPSGVPYEDARPDPFPEELIVNADPNANNATAGTMAYVPVNGKVSGSDADGDKIYFSSASSTVTSQGTLTLNPDGTWTYTPAYGFTGTASFSFKASDDYGGESPVRSLIVTVATNPADSDGDGIADGYEYEQWGSLASADGEGDADLDGQSNYFEFLAGTDPLDAGERLDTAPSVAGTSSANGTIKLSLTHVRPGVNYHLETSSDLDEWTRLGTFTFSVAGAAEIEDPTPATSVPKFYRMNLEATPAVILP